MSRHTINISCNRKFSASSLKHDLKKYAVYQEFIFTVTQCTGVMCSSVLVLLGTDAFPVIIKAACSKSVHAKIIWADAKIRKEKKRKEKKRKEKNVPS